MTTTTLNRLHQIDQARDRAIGSLHAAERRMAEAIARLETATVRAFDAFSTLAERLPERLP